MGMMTWFAFFPRDPAFVASPDQLRALFDALQREGYLGHWPRWFASDGGDHPLACEGYPDASSAIAAVSPASTFRLRAESIQLGEAPWTDVESVTLDGASAPAPWPLHVEWVATEAPSPPPGTKAVTTQGKRRSLFGKREVTHGFSFVHLDDGATVGLPYYPPTRALLRMSFGRGHMPQVAIGNMSRGQPQLVGLVEQALGVGVVQAWYMSHLAYTVHRDDDGSLVYGIGRYDT